MIRKILTLILLLLFCTPLIAQWDYGFEFTKAGTAGLQFLKIGTGARESGMGEVGICETAGVNSIFWNPAGIAHTQQQEAIFSHHQWLLDIQLTSAAGSFEIGKWGVIGISAIYLGIPEFEETTVKEQDGTGRKINAGDLAIGLAYARRFTDKLAMGGQLRYVREQLDQDAFVNILFDLGAIYHTGFRNMRIAVCAQHFGPDIKMLRDTFRMPLIFKVGLADDLFKSSWQRLGWEVNLLHPTDNKEKVNLGLEYTFLDRISFRSGYRFNSDTGQWAFGLGLNTSLLGIRSSIDYAYSDFGEILGAVNQFTIKFGF